MRVKKMTMQKYSTIIGILIIGLFASCDNSRIFDSNESIEGNVWDMTKPISFVVSIDDTLQPYNFYVNFRHKPEYEFSNIFFFIDTDFPNGEKRRDTLECSLQNKEGKWYGSNTGGVKDHQILFKRGHRFPFRGNYKFTFEQAMREPQLKNVEAVGMRIEKFNP